MGKGVLRLMRHNATGRARLLARDGAGRVFLNVPLVAGMRFVPLKANDKLRAMMFIAPSPDGASVVKYILQTLPEDFNGTLQAILTELHYFEL